MRTIKFRVWNNRRKHFSYRENFNGKEQQFTGLLDKNGKEIYEGDIVMIRHPYLDGDEPRQFVIKYWYCSFGVDGQERLDGSKRFLSFADYPDIQEHCKVIGNIYENPELIGVHS